MPLTPANVSPATLSRRQRHFYQHLCDVWAPDPQYGSGAQDSVDQGTRWRLVEQNVRCFFQMTKSLDEVDAFGRIQGDGGNDIVFFGLDQDVDEDYILANKTTNPGGIPSHNYGQFWRVKGPATIFSNANRRTGGRKAMYAYREKVPPKGVSVT
jgi:hypothetical protein